MARMGERRRSRLSGRMTALLACAIGLAACDVPKSMHVRTGVDPKYEDDDVRFRTTYFFRVYDACFAAIPRTPATFRTDSVFGGKNEDQPLTLRFDSLYRFRMTGKANSLFNKIHFESGTLHKSQIDPFGNSVRFDQTNNNFRVVTREQTEEKARRDERYQEIERLMKLKTDMASVAGGDRRIDALINEFLLTLSPGGGRSGSSETPAATARIQLAEAERLLAGAETMTKSAASLMRQSEQLSKLAEGIFNEAEKERERLIGETRASYDAVDVANLAANGTMDTNAAALARDLEEAIKQTDGADRAEAQRLAKIAHANAKAAVDLIRSAAAHSLAKAKNEQRDAAAPSDAKQFKDDAFRREQRNAKDFEAETARLAKAAASALQSAKAYAAEVAKVKQAASTQPTPPQAPPAAPAANTVVVGTAGTVSATTSPATGAAPPATAKPSDLQPGAERAEKAAVELDQSAGELAKRAKNLAVALASLQLVQEARTKANDLKSLAGKVVAATRDPGANPAAIPTSISDYAQKARDARGAARALATNMTTIEANLAKLIQNAPPSSPLADADLKKALDDLTKTLGDLAKQDSAGTAFVQKSNAAAQQAETADEETQKMADAAQPLGAAVTALGTALANAKWTPAGLSELTTLATSAVSAARALRGQAATERSAAHAVADSAARVVAASTMDAPVDGAGKRDASSSSPSSACPPGTVGRRGFQILGPEGWRTFDQDERLIMAMSSSAKPLIGVLQEVSSRTLAPRLNPADRLLPLVTERLRISEAERKMQTFQTLPPTTAADAVTGVLDAFDPPPRQRPAP